MLRMILAELQAINAKIGATCGALTPALLANPSSPQLTLINATLQSLAAEQRAWMARLEAHMNQPAP